MAKKYADDSLEINCSICKNLKKEEYGFYKYGWPEKDIHLPIEVSKLVEFNPQRSKENTYGKLLICPECHLVYSYKESYEYLVNGGEDCYDVARLEEADLKKSLSPESFQDWKKKRG